MQESELKALVSLLDDEDKQVSSHVEEKILSIGKEVIPFLEKEWESTFNPALQQRIEELIHTLQYDLVRDRLKEWYASKDQDLLTGMWILATYQYPDIDLTNSSKSSNRFITIRGWSSGKTCIRSIRSK